MRARSDADFNYKFEIVLPEADESHYLLEIIKKSQIKTGDGVNRLIIRVNKLTAILAATVKTVTEKKTAFYRKL